MRKEKLLETKIPVILGIIYGVTVWGRSLLLASYRVVAACSYFLVHCSLLPYLSYMDRKKMGLECSCDNSNCCYHRGAGWALLYRSWTGLVDVFCNIPHLSLDKIGGYTHDEEKSS